MGLIGRLKHAWNIFKNKDPTGGYYNLGPSYGYRPDRMRFSCGNEKSIVTSVYNRIAMDVASITIQHVKMDANNRFVDVVDSCLNNCLTLEANIDQSGRAFIQDVVMSMLDEGCVAMVPVDTDDEPEESGNFKIYTMRTGRIRDWYPEHVRVEVYNQAEGRRREVILPKETLAIIENPMWLSMSPIRRCSGWCES